MRLWSLHPTYLDAKGLVALWREALLAQKVLAGATLGYRRHPQLTRFSETERPLDAIAAYLRGVHRESTERGYRFDAERIVRGPLLAGEAEAMQPGPDAEPVLMPDPASVSGTEAGTAGLPLLPVPDGQLRYEAELLIFKLRLRSPGLVDRLESDLRNNRLLTHPLFTPVPGPIAPWERVREDL
ncbi:pyrimidine dimer DNA glycosylase/endonuclease V [Curtobacterium sp. S6]|uniref:pyrimidine dimer DNA glycosylase/endonuclease V n=1 Tax=Curtobacterium sp. S6 TaxID=1479623 RepID=UPI0004AB42D9|nr:pyrimidine dimer DNA glycosylase/endonuclease V [Curtobacterium sp. S6]